MGGVAIINVFVTRVFLQDGVLLGFGGKLILGTADQRPTQTAVLFGE